MLSLSPFFFFLLSMQVIKPQIIQKQKISPDTNVQKTYTNIKQFFCRRISPFGIAPVEKAHKARTCWYRGPFNRFINTRSEKSKKGIDKSNKQKTNKQTKVYKCIKANISAIWQHAAHTTDQLTSPSC